MPKIKTTLLKAIEEQIDEADRAYFKNLLNGFTEEELVFLLSDDEEYHIPHPGGFSSPYFK